MQSNLLIYKLMLLQCISKCEDEAVADQLMVSTLLPDDLDSNATCAHACRVANKVLHT